MKDGSRKEWERASLVYFLCAPNVGPGGGPQPNHSRHAVEWEDAALTSFIEAVETHTNTQGLMEHTQLLDSTVVAIYM